MDASYESCTLCPRGCRADRASGARGFCGETAEMTVARAAPHYWEEPCLSGEKGSGAVFFCGCPLRCVFCQNRDISQRPSGKILSPQQLCDVMLRLEVQGVHNINLVTAGHFAPSAAEAVRLAKANGLAIPVVWNSSGYEKPQTLAMLDGLIDIWLPDFKYWSPETAMRYSSAPDYVEYAKSSLDFMFESAGEPVFSDDGMMTRGVIVRHLVLPSHTHESAHIIDYVHSRFKDRVYLSIMNQYTPLEPLCCEELKRKVTKREYSAVLDHALEIGVENGFFQEGGTVSESFIPGFDGTGL